jgi:integrase/recombinase XerD
MTHLRKMMLEELERRNYAQTTIDCYIQTIEDFARHFRRSPDQLTPEHIREYQAYLFRERKLAPSTVTQRLAALAQDRLQRNRASRNRGLKRKIIS